MLLQRFYMGLEDILKENVDDSVWGEFLSKSFYRSSSSIGHDGSKLRLDDKRCTITHVMHSLTLDPRNTIEENIATLMTQMSLLTKNIVDSGTKK
ncbi:hypothetical protein HAX54_027495, partial [Datura stramonium]|nr:hypothetical protein [Datura stramonium]